MSLYVISVSNVPPPRASPPPIPRVGKNQHLRRKMRANHARGSSDQHFSVRETPRQTKDIMPTHLRALLVATIQDSLYTYTHISQDSNPRKHSRRHSVGRPAEKFETMFALPMPRSHDWVMKLFCHTRPHHGLSFPDVSKDVALFTAQTGRRPNPLLINRRLESVGSTLISYFVIEQSNCVHSSFLSH